MNEENWLKEETVSYYNNEEINQKKEAKVFLKYLKGKVLDLGCGCGRISKFLYDNGVKDIIGIEINKEMVEIARKKYPMITFFKGDAMSINFPDSTFDSIYFNILDFLEERKEVIKEVHRVLKPKGVFLTNLHIPNYKDFKKTPYYLNQKTKIGEFNILVNSKKNNIKLFNNYGFKFVKTIKRSFGDGNPYFIFKKVKIC